ncbi:MAG: hypothetical protein A4E30_01195 [Methanomassiliicoccales archaeon PtaB.Bin215]|nr:MAG: hypothetical protein A4E30_01195 [Methanomassiliicoccales archaeon PtaB.Bin215]
MSSDGNGLNNRTFTAPTFLPWARSWSTTKRTVPAVEPMATIRYSASSVRYPSTRSYLLPVSLANSAITWRVTSTAFSMAVTIWYLIS